MNEDLEALEAIAETVRRARPDGTRRALSKFPLRSGGSIKGQLATAAKRRFDVTLPALKCLAKEPST